jgi:YD repeat-containing protein
VTGVQTCALPISEQAAAYIGRGDAYTKLDEYGKAADDFETAISIDPALEDSYRIRIEALRSGGEYEDEKGNRYNVYGKKTRMMAYDAGGKLMWYHEYVYDEHGRSKSVTVFDADGNQTDYFDGFAYDENGNRTIAYGYMDDDGSICVCNHYTFDDNGNMLHMDTYNMSGVLTGYFDYSYGSDVKSTGYSEYDRNGNLVTYTEFTYNEQGLRTKIVYYKADGSVRGRSEFKYDADGICTESDNYDAAGNLVNHNVNKSS